MYSHLLPGRPRMISWAHAFLPDMPTQIDTSLGKAERKKKRYD